MVLPFIPAVFNAAKKQTLAAASKERSEILAAAEEIKEWIVDIRHKIHEHPELGFDCGDTAELVKATLTELGIFFYDKSFAKTGVVGRIGSGNEPFVALRADMDALPLQELYEWTHMSQNKGVMHACGHDAHTAMLLGAAKLLQERYEKKEFEGTVFLIFQPSEEANAGASSMVNDGALMEAQAIFGLHVTPSLPAGACGSRAGVVMAGSSRFGATIEGLGGHGGVPQAAIDPIVGSAFVITSLQPIISRETEPSDAQVITIGYVHGGTANNIIPDSVDIGGTYRYVEVDDAIVDERKSRILEVIEKQAAVHRCTATASFSETHSYPPLINTGDAYEFVKDVAEKVLGNKELFIEAPSPATASEDFPYYLKEIPGAFYFVGCAAPFPEDNEFYPVHNPKFVLDENVLPVGTAIQAAVAMAYLKDKPNLTKP